MLADIVKNNINILMISETKLDSFFPKGQFQLHGYSEPYRFGRNGNDGGILLFIPEDMPSKLIESQIRIEVFFIELSQRGKLLLGVIHLARTQNFPKN